MRRKDRRPTYVGPFASPTAFAAAGPLLAAQCVPIDVDRTGAGGAPLAGSRCRRPRHKQTRCAATGGRRHGGTAFLCIRVTGEQRENQEYKERRPGKTTAACSASSVACT